MHKKTLFAKLLPVKPDKTDELVKSLEEKLDCRAAPLRGHALFFHRATMQHEAFCGKGVLLLRLKGALHFDVRRAHQALSLGPYAAPRKKGDPQLFTELSAAEFLEDPAALFESSPR